MSEHRDRRLDVVAHRQRARRRAQPRDRRRSSPRTASSTGAMTLVDAERAERALRGDGPGGRDLGRLGARTRRSASRRSAARAAFIGRVADDELGTVFAPRPPRRRRRVRRAARDRRRADRPLPRHRHARRRSARCARTSARRRELDPSDVDADLDRARAQVTYLEGYLWDQPDGQGRVSAARRASRTRPAAGSRSRSPTRSASTATATSSSSSSRPTSTSCSPTRPRSRALRGRRRSTTRSQRVRGHCEIAALTRGAQGSVIVARRRGARRSTPIPVGERGRHHRRRRPVRRRVPLRPHPRLRPRARCGRLGALARGRGDLAPRRPARDVARRARRARCSSR